MELAMWIAGALAAAGALSLGSLFYLGFIRPPSGSLTEHRERGGDPSTACLVVCAGDSTTHASLSADYVGMLRERYAGRDYEFVNAGRNGDTSDGLLRRIDAICACRPDRVTILVGTNDARAHRDPKTTPEAFGANLSAVLIALRQRTEARVAVLSPPPLGEALESEANAVVARYRAVAAEVAREHGAAYLPFGERLLARIGERAGRGHDAEPFRLSPSLLLGAAFRRFAMRERWDAISARRGLIVTTDRIHLNERSASVAASLIDAWLERAPGG